MFRSFFRPSISSSSPSVRRRTAAAGAGGGGGAGEASADTSSSQSPSPLDHRGSSASVPHHSMSVEDLLRHKAIADKLAERDKKIEQLKKKHTKVIKRNEKVEQVWFGLVWFGLFRGSCQVS